MICERCQASGGGAAECGVEGVGECASERADEDEGEGEGEGAGAGEGECERRRMAWAGTVGRTGARVRPGTSRHLRWQRAR